jgi:hypothetical protein
MAIFYVCETRNSTPCVFSPRTMQPLWKRTGGDTARCIRHGALITDEIHEPSIEAARKRVKKESAHSTR